MYYICTWVPPLEEQGEGRFKNPMDDRLAEACSSSQAGEKGVHRDHSQFDVSSVFVEMQ